MTDEIDEDLKIIFSNTLDEREACIAKDLRTSLHSTRTRGIQIVFPIAPQRRHHPFSDLFV